MQEGLVSRHSSHRQSGVLLPDVFWYPFTLLSPHPELREKSSYPITPTPYREDDEVDLDSVCRLVRFLIDGGAQELRGRSCSWMQVQ